MDRVLSGSGGASPITAGTGGASVSAGSGGTSASNGSGGAAAIGANSGSGGSIGTVKPAMPSEVTYHRDIRPLIEARCASCHVTGGVGPFPLTTWAEVEAFAGPVVNAVKTRKMPPWLADSADCIKLNHDQRLTDAQLQLFTKWQADGFLEGSEADFVPLASEAPSRVLGEPTIIATAETFQLPRNYEDYVCKQIDKSFDEDTWVTAMDILPQQREYVHHAIVSVGRGSCSALGIGSDNVYSYRPGSRTLAFEEGDAMLIPAGSVIAIQFHYNTKFAPAGTMLPTDASQLRLWTLPAGQKPLRQIARLGNHDMFINIPVGAVDQLEGGSLSIGSEYARPGAEIIGMSPHMHYLGQTFKETLYQADGTEVCLVNVPNWDQDWQLDYLFDPAHYIPISYGASVDQECTFSNRAEDQGKDPVTGQPFTPQYTTFGENTRQEMCLGYIWFRYPL